MDLKEIEKLLDPYRVIFVSLVILVFINGQLQGFNDAILSSLTALVVSVAVDVIATYIKTKKIILSYGPAISGLILALVFSPNLPLYNIAGTAALAQVLKHIVRYKNNNLFNPASLAMIIVFLQVPAEAWWGNKIPEALILGLIVSWRIKRLPASITFMIAYTIFSMLVGSLIAKSQQPIANYIDLSTGWVFFAFFMLVEPRTSPRALKAQIMYASLIALIATMGFTYSLHSPILLALLIGNAASTFYFSKLKN